MKSNLLKQVIKFGFVGGLCFLIDFGLMMIVVEFLSLNYILACAISFIIANIVNYILSVKLVFTKINSLSIRNEFIIFVIMSVFGLILTEFLMLIFVEKLNFIYSLSKVLVTLIVMVYNFISRKIVFEGRKIYEQ